MFFKEVTMVAHVGHKGVQVSVIWESQVEREEEVLAINWVARTFEVSTNLGPITSWGEVALRCLFEDLGLACGPVRA